MLEAVPNFSEGRRLEVIDRISGAFFPGHLLDVHPDAAHNRTVVSVCAAPGAALADELVAAVAAAVEGIDLRTHQGLHPRVGAADVLPLVPLGSATLEDAAAMAQEIASRIWTELRVPVHLYGRAFGGTTLADIRAGRARLAFGDAPHPTAGAVCVGARPPLVAYNVRLPGASPAAAAALARGLRASSPGGMPGVQALAFRLPEGGMQLSMNLVDVAAAPPAAVLAEVRRRAAALGVEPGPDEVVGLCPAAVAPPSAAGRLLEARIAAAAARAGAAAARRSESEEHVLLAARLEAAAAGLAALGPAGDGVLVAAERAAALPRVLAAAGLRLPEAEAMLAHAALALRSAVPPAILEAEPDRVRLLDQWLQQR